MLFKQGPHTKTPSHYHAYNDKRSDMSSKEILFLSHPEAGPWAAYPDESRVPLQRRTVRGSGYLENVSLILADALERGVYELADEVACPKSDRGGAFLPSLFAPAPSADFLDRCRQSADRAESFAALLEEGLDRRHQSVLGLLHYLPNGRRAPQPAPAAEDQPSGSGSRGLFEVEDTSPAPWHQDYGIFSLIPESSGPGLEAFSFFNSDDSPNRSEAFPDLLQPGRVGRLWAAPPRAAEAELSSSTPSSSGAGVSYVPMLVMAGATLQFLSDGTIIATEHRVTRAFGEDPRKSIILFAFARDEALLATPGELQEALIRARRAVWALPDGSRGRDASMRKVQRPRPAPPAKTAAEFVTEAKAGMGPAGSVNDL